MTVTIQPSAISGSAGYGAREIKIAIILNTRRAFLWNMSWLALILLLGSVIPVITALLFPEPAVVRVRTARMSIEAVLLTLPQPPELPPPPPRSAPSAPAQSGMVRLGVPVPVPESEVGSDARTFSDVPVSDGPDVNGSVGEGNGYGAGYGTTVTTSESPQREEMSPDEVLPLDSEPSFDYAELQRRIEYPDLARRAGVVGTVLVGALIDTDGAVVKTQILDSESELLNKAAVSAVSGTVFIPAKMNHRAVRAWVRIPIRFSIR